MNKILLCMTLITCVLHGGDSESSSDSPFQGEYARTAADGTVTIIGVKGPKIEKYETYIHNPEDWDGPFLDEHRDAYYYVKKNENSGNDTCGSETIEQKEKTNESIIDGTSINHAFDAVKSEALHESPYSSCGRLMMEYIMNNKTKKYAGTGFLINENIVMTAAHNVFDYMNEVDSNIPASKVHFALQAHNNQIGPACTHYYMHPEWEKKLDSAYDIALLFFPHSMDNQLVLKTAFKAQDVKVIGYPSGHEKMHEAKGKAMYDCDEKVSHKVNTLPGNSGSPIISQKQGDFVVGVHTNGKSEGSEYNKGVRIKQSIIKFINESIDQYNRGVYPDYTKHIKVKAFTKSDLSDAEKKTEINMAKNLLDNDINIDVIMQAVKILTKDEVSKLKDEIDRNREINANDAPAPKKQKVSYI
ncbi:trypsin-like serine peptidase [Candidatus Cytomitobacter primus]|uniref:Serine protease n=1 Tax=Candidatus Cytomitobacter primus TaxID=2066024 RepID=A0A5C0UIC2_9PROT|nr:trypsin-like serine protease [Candidatus Cytomitobacter primus]QEK38684.1 trypsin-like serine protease [Candidatus Cytomitobacter primus]